jgi:hypothetical protein
MDELILLSGTTPEEVAARREQDSEELEQLRDQTGGYSVDYG